MKKVNLLLIVVIVLLVSCSSNKASSNESLDESIRESNWGDNIESVTKKEEELGNSEYTEEVLDFDLTVGEVVYITYLYDIVAFDQDVFMLNYEFKKNFKGKEHSEPVLFEATFFFDDPDSGFDYKKLLKEVNKMYGKGKKGTDAMGGPTIEWTNGDTYITLFNNGNLNYVHKSENRMRDE